MRRPRPAEARNRTRPSCVEETHEGLCHHGETARRLRRALHQLAMEIAEERRHIAQLERELAALVQGR